MQERNGRQKIRTILLIVLSVLLAAVIAATAFFYLRQHMKESSYSEAISSAEKYLAQNQYEDAIIQYEKAISIDPANEEAYLALADVYTSQGQTEEAYTVLTRGYTATGSPKIQLLLSRWDSQTPEPQDLTAKPKEEEVDLGTASNDIAWNTSFLQRLSSYTYADYRNEYGGMGEISRGEDDFLEVVHSGVDGTFYYRNTDEAKDVVDSSRGTPTNTGMPEKLVLNDLGQLFRNFDGRVRLERLQMLFGERVEPKLFEGRMVVEKEIEDCIIRIETDDEGNIISPNAWNEIIILNANKGEKKAGVVSGVVLDAVRGNGISGAQLKFIPSDHSLDTEVAVTGAQGTFTVELEPDLYSIEITADGYIDETYLFTVEDGKTYSGEQFTLSPMLTTGTARIVLEWNAQPRDLDSYLDGRTDSGASVSTNYMRPQSRTGGDVLAELDLDDVDGYGPETTTIYDLNGVYTFRVRDFHATGTMAANGASVKVYLPGKDPVTITLDPGSGVENIWEVCVIDHGELQILNRGQ